jgi:spore germination cell wall hydrolase CwlJ-like protein
VSVRTNVPQKRQRWIFARIGFGALAIALMPSTIGFQDLGALLAGQPAVAERARARLIASPFGTIHAAMFSLPRPVGTAIPPPPLYALANFDPSDITGSIGSQPLGDPMAPLQFPKVNRKNKRDSMLSRARAPMPPLPPVPAIEPAPEAAADPAKSEKQTGRFEPYSDYEFPEVVDRGAAGAENDLPQAEPNADVSRQEDAIVRGENIDAGRVFFGADPFASTSQSMSPWAPGKAPVIMAAHTSGDYDIKQSALEPQPNDIAEGQSVAKKGEVTGAEQRPRSPAERLALSSKTRPRAEKCLANAIYFESRDEPVRAQIAVAQVVMNRVFSPFYPKDVCGVVYQNAHRRLACQFTFACDGHEGPITEPSAWSRAQRIARDVLDGKLWMPEVAKSTHYHDYWARPNWIGEMKKMDRLGGLIFYRPRRWGDGSDEPHWGNAKATEAEAKRL